MWSQTLAACLNHAHQLSVIHAPLTLMDVGGWQEIVIKITSLHWQEMVIKISSLSHPTYMYIYICTCRGVYHQGKRCQCKWNIIKIEGPRTIVG